MKVLLSYRFLLGTVLTLASFGWLYIAACVVTRAIIRTVRREEENR